MSDAIDEITRGKWEVDDRLNVRSGEFLVAQVSGSTQQERKANARLISIAPEMYRLLEECADELNAIGLPTLSQECYEMLDRVGSR